MSRCLSRDIHQNTHNLMAKVMVSLNFLCLFHFMCMPLDLLWLSLLFRHDLVESNSLLILISFLIFAFCPFCFAWSYLMFPSFCNYPTNGESQLLAGRLLFSWNLTLASQHWERSGLTQPKCPWVLEEQWKAKEVLKLARLTPKPLRSAGLLLSRVCRGSLICGLCFVPRQTSKKCRRSPLDLLLRG